MRQFQLGHLSPFLSFLSLNHLKEHYRTYKALLYFVPSLYMPYFLKIINFKVFVSIYEFFLIQFLSPV